MFSSGPSSDGSIFVLFRQEDKDFHQVRSWPHSTIIHQINNSEFWPIKGGICHVFGGLVVQIKLMLFISLFIFFLIFKFCFY